jgi:hypothetical protein
VRGTLSRSIETKKSWIWFFRCSPKAGEVSSPEQPQKDRRDHSRLKLLQHRMGKLSPSRVVPFRSRFAQPRCLWTAHHCLLCLHLPKSYIPSSRSLMPIRPWRRLVVCDP